ncbi:SpoIID/LytB domain-containing protein [Jonesiaceae bacterium BS-20]|uniref:SpoIID/LytB domain-containing protein n=1 Tax=Jonesiaceae bacterium BS-20 TaxID=3120821 RepID=A0AAU7DXK1_9MICO
MRFFRVLGLVCTLALLATGIVAIAPTPAQAANVTYYVNSSSVKLNVRSTANGTVVDKIAHGTKVTHNDAAKNRVKAGNYTWRLVTFAKGDSEKGRTSGWVAENYLGKTKPGAAKPPATPQATTMYVNSSGTKLNVRKTANGTPVDKLAHGAKISFVNSPANRVKAGNYTWRKITFAKSASDKGNTTGWVAEDYLSTTDPKATNKPKPPVPPAATTMYVNSSGTKLNVRKTANGSQVDKLAHGTKISFVNIPANRVKAGSHTWRLITFAKGDAEKGNTKGWVAEQYLSSTNPKPPTKPTPPPEKPTPPPAPKQITYYVDSSSVNLNVRSTANGAIVDKLRHATKVTYTDIAANRVKAGSHTWRLIEFPKGASEKGYTKGWVAEQYLSLHAPFTPPTPPPSTGDVPKSFAFSGAGFGHGVGMPQYGAYQMAREGKSASQILGHYYAGSTVANAATSEYIRVQILGPEPYSFNGYADSRTSSTFSIQNRSAVPTAKFSVQNANAQNIANATGLPANHTVTLAVSGTSVKATVLDASGKKVTETTQPKIHLVWSGTSRYEANGPQAVTQIAGAQGTYRHGRMAVSAIGGKLNVVNELKLNTEYLYGIAEVPSGWGNNGGAAALQAQAVTARTYAMSRPKVNTKCDCNVVDDVRDQNFTGWKKEGEGSNGSAGKIWKAAVDATVTSGTNAQVLQKGGKPVTTYYYSYSGGKTSNSEDVWSSKIDYLRSVNDPYSLNAPGSPGQWVHTVSQAQAKALFPTLNNVAKIEITASYSSGQLKTLTATSSTGQKQTRTLKADQWRTAVKGKNNKIATSSSSSSLPGSWVTKITAN